MQCKLSNIVLSSHASHVALQVMFNVRIATLNEYTYIKAVISATMP